MAVRGLGIVFPPRCYSLISEKPQCDQRLGANFVLRKTQQANEHVSSQEIFGGGNV